MKLSILLSLQSLQTFNVFKYCSNQYIRTFPISLLPLFLSVIVFAAYLAGCSTIEKTITLKQEKDRLDPLSMDEINAIVNFLKHLNKTDQDTRFALIELHEPPKNITKSSMESRHAYVLMYNWKTRSADEAIVDLKRNNLVSWSKLPTRQPPNTFLIVERIEEIVFPNPRWRKAMSARGINDYSAISLWPDLLPYQEIKDSNGKLLIPVIALNNNPVTAENRYLNLSISVNLSDGTITEFTDKGYTKPNTAPLIPEQDDDKDYTPPDNTRVKIEGSHISWENWRLRFSVNPRRGLEIYDVKYIDRRTERSILYRASLSEIVTPYGDPSWYSWYPSDEGDLNFANYALISANNNDVPGYSAHSPTVVHDAKGNPKTIDKAVSIYEMYTGLKWRHYQQSRPAYDLRLSSHFMVDNYDYVVTWVFKQNGSIVVEVTLTGMINYGITKRKRATPYQQQTFTSSNTLVEPGVYGPIHQHFFVFRLDFDIDGHNNSAAEINSSMIPKNKENKNEEWFQAETTIFRKEEDAIRRTHIASSRNWKIFNPNTTTKLGHHPSYHIIPKDNTYPLPGINSKVRKKAGFIDANFWVTPYAKEEMYAAGKYLGAGFNKEGLPKWVQANRDINNRDIVVWYTMGTTHMPRPEDWPVMPSKTISFELMPFGFFNKNPSMN